MLDISLNSKGLQKKLGNMPGTIAKAQSIALERTARAGAKAMAKDGQRALDDPIPAIFNGRKARNRVGWIYFEWDERADIKRKGQGNAFVQVQGFGPEQARREQQEAIHRQVYGTRERRGVTPAIPFIIRPSRKLLRDKKIKGVPFVKLDKHGNIRNYRKMMDKVSRDPRFFSVPLGSFGGGFKLNGIPVAPGLYFRYTRVRRYRRHPVTRRSGGPYGGGSKTKQSTGFVTVLTYHTVRQYKKRWDFEKETLKAMRKKYPQEFLSQLFKQLKK